jgi:Holliday junction resolvase
MSSYNKGAYFERRCRKALEKQGFFVVRSAGSRGPADLVAFKTGMNKRTLLIQCTLDKGSKNITDFRRLCSVAQKTGCYPVLAVREAFRGPIRWFRVADPLGALEELPKWLIG